MKAKNGYKFDKSKHSTGKWLKRYFKKRTIRRFKKSLLLQKNLPDNINKLIDENFWDLK